VRRPRPSRPSNHGGSLCHRRRRRFNRGDPPRVFAAQVFRPDVPLVSAPAPACRRR
jgi:hypothetical protein